MRYLILICAIFILQSNGFSQNKRDYVWLFGGSDWEQDIPGIQCYQFDFKHEPFEVEPITYFAYPFDNNNTSICDKEGNLLFYSNGCAVMNADHQVMANGDSINYGDFFRILWKDDCKNGYPGSQNIITLTDPSNNSGYYIIHKEISYKLGEYSYPWDLKYTYVDMSLDLGKGAVTTKNKAFTKYQKLQSNYLTAIQHQNGSDWWIIQPMQDNNEFMIVSLDENGFQGEENQPMGFETNDDWFGAGGTAKFSPDGTKYALYNYYHQLHIYDFNRSTGQLSNHIEVEVYPKGTKTQYFCSVEWSPNSRYIYTASRSELHQIDTFEEDLHDGISLIGTYDGTQNPFSTTFVLMAQGPDCRIYMCSASSTKTYHVINNPNEKGLSCNFDQNGIQLPYSSSRASMPNHPRWRVDEEEKCDPTISSVFGIPVYTRKNLEVYPNPTKDLVNIKIPENQKGTIEIRNNKGLLILTEQVLNQTMEMQLSLGRYSSGLYYVEFVPDVNKEKIIYTNKLDLIK